MDRGRDHQVLAVLLVMAADIDDDLRGGHTPPRSAGAAALTPSSLPPCPSVRRPSN